MATYLARDAAVPRVIALELAVDALGFDAQEPLASVNKADCAVVQYLLPDRSVPLGPAEWSTV